MPNEIQPPQVAVVKWIGDGEEKSTDKIYRYVGESENAWNNRAFDAFMEASQGQSVTSPQSITFHWRSGGEDRELTVIRQPGESLDDWRDRAIQELEAAQQQYPPD